MQKYGKRCFSGALAVAVGVVAFGGTLVTADPALANTPGGVACNAADGKINGRGSTYQNNAQALFWNGFDSDVCGNTPSSGGDIAVNNMGIYNYPSAVAGSFTGSGAGQKAANCRTDAYAGTDLPYTEAILAGLNGTPGNGVVGGCSTFPTQPFAPDAATNGTTFPSASDIAAPIMSFPIAGSSVALEINLTAADCGGTKPSGIAFTPAQITALFGGSVTQWNSPVLTAGNTSLDNCTTSITRVVRQDNSGTTGIFKNYLIRIDDARTAATCAPGTTWTSYDGTPNTSWPVTGGTCSPLTTATTSGGPALVSLLDTTNGGVGYADLADAVNGVGLVTASVQNAAGTGNVSPAAGKAANCDYSSLTLPGFSSSDAVGLNTTDNWGSDNAVVNGGSGSIDHENATDLGVKYPICGLTFDLVYSGLSAGPTTASAVANLTADQRRTLYSFMTYVLSSTAQNKLGSNYYAPLPTTWIPTLLGGFQSNF